MAGHEKIDRGNEAGVVFRVWVTPAYRRRIVLGSFGMAACFVAGFTAGMVIATRGHPEFVSAFFWVLLAAGMIGGAFGWRLMPGPRAMAISRLGVAYDSSEFGLATPWHNVRELVRTGNRPEALALRFERPAVMREMSWFWLRSRPWRHRQAWDRTVPLEPFLLGDPAGGVLREIRARAPHLVLAEPRVERSLLSRPWVKTVVGLGSSAVIGFVWASRMLTPVGDLTLTYGPPHECWETADGRIAGCRLEDGTVIGRQDGAPVTCFFPEPRSIGAKSYNCLP